MPVPPAKPATSLVSQAAFTAGGGTQMLPPPTLVVTLPATSPPVTSTAATAINIVGTDAVPFSFDLSSPVLTYTFPNLPARSNTANPLAPSLTAAAQQPLSINAIDQLLFVVSLQGLVAPAGTVVGVAPQAIDRNNVRAPGPFLGANVWATFQAVLTIAGGASTGIVSGTLVGLLHRSSG